MPLLALLSAGKFYTGWNQKQFLNNCVNKKEFIYTCISYCVWGYSRWDETVEASVEGQKYHRAKITRIYKVCSLSHFTHQYDSFLSDFYI